MAIKPLNSIAGFSTGDPAVTIVQANGDITTINLTANGISNLGPNGNVHITGGSAGQALTTDGLGNLSWASVAGLPGGSNTQVQYNNNGAFGGDSGLTYDSATTTLTANNFIVSTSANFGAVANITITGGSNGQAIITDGNGVLSFGSVSGSQSAAPMPIVIDSGNTLTIPANYQGLFGTPITVNGELVVDGMLIDVSGQGAAGSNAQIQFNDQGDPGANNGFTFNKTTGNLNVPGNIIAAGDVLPAADLIYDLGSSTRRWRDGYFSGNTIYLGDALIQSNATAMWIINGDGGNFVIGGNTTTSTSQLGNGTSNVSVPIANGNVIIGANGNANIFVVSGTGIVVNGTANLGGVSNVKITGGTNGQVLSTNGSGDLSWVSVSSSSISNGNSNVSVPTAAGNVNISVNGTANVVTVTDTGANISGTLNVTGNANAGNIGATTGVFTTVAGSLTTALQPNITTVGTLSSLTVTGKVNAGQLQGDGGNISNIQGANVSGAVAYATTANSVAGANVSGTVGTATTAGTVTTAAQPNITSVGTLSSLAVNGNLTAPNIISNTGAFYGNATGLTNIPGANITGNISGNISNADHATTANTVTTASQPNITSVGTLSSLAVTGNITTSANLVTDLIAGKTSGITLSAAGTNQDIVLRPSGTGIIDTYGAKVGNLATPTADSDAATKAYVDAAVTSIHVHNSCYVATTGTLNAASGGTVSYNNGTGGVGATLTTTGTYLLIDGGNVQTVGTRILVKNEANAAWNGIYVYTSTTVLTRSSDFDTSAEAAGGDFVFVTSGTINADTGWVQTTDNPILGTSNIVWTQFSGAGTYQAGTGLTLTGSVFSISNTTVTGSSYGNGDVVATFTVNDQGQLTAAANVVITANAANLSGTTLASSIVTSNLTTVGTITAGVWNNNIGLSATFASGLSGANLSSLTGSNVTGQVGNALVAGTVYTAAQPNITSVGTLSSLAVTGNITGGNANVTGQLISTVATGTSPIVVSSTTKVANLNADTVDGYDTATANTASTIAVRDTNGNLSANFFIGNGSQLTGIITSVSNVSNGNSNLDIPSANGNINLSVSGNANILVVTGTGANISGTLNVTGNANAGNIGATTGVFTTVAGTLSTAAQPNITSLGTLSSLTVSGNGLFGNVYANSGIIGALTLKGEGGNISNIQVGNVTGLGNIATVNLTGSTSNVLYGNGVFAAPVGAVGATGATGPAGASGPAGATGSVGAATVVSTADTFTGDGATTAFTLTASPASTAYTIVNIEGVLQLKTAYSIVGTTLTFTEAPNNGAVIEVQSLTSGSAVGATGATGVQGATGVIGYLVSTVNTFTGTGSQSVFTMTVEPLTIAYTNVVIDGVTQLKNAYSVNGTSLIFTAPPTNGAVIDVTIYTGGNAVGQTGATGANGATGASGVAVVSATVDSFVGNGVQTAYTLTVTPTSKNNTIVNIDGIIQLASVYSLAGATLTFVAPPSNGANIQVTSLTSGSAVGATGATGAFGVIAPVTNTFTGNGVQTAYTLTVAPVNIDYTNVNVNGVYQLKTAYSVVGTTLTFTSAPANGASIDVQILTGGSAVGGTGATGITGATGAAAATIPQAYTWFLT